LPILWENSAKTQPAKVTPFAGGNGATVRKRAAGRFFPLIIVAN
jgi:hypothetical protein